MLDFLGPDPSQTWEKSTNATLSTLSGNIDGIMDRVVCNQPITGGVIPEIENVANLTGNADDSLILGKSAITSQRREDLGLESYKSTSSIDALTGETLSNSNDSNLPISQIVEEAVRSAHRYLSGLASDPDFNAKMNLAFGDSWNADVASNLVQKFALGDFSEIPVIEILPSAAINGANGAFAKLTNTIYLAKEFVQENAGNLGAITSVVLEETGHFIDSKVNVSDAAGDEGDIFARVVEGKELSAGELLDLKAEDDSTVLTLNGQVFWIEQSANKKADFNGDGRTDFIRQEKGAWDDDDINTANVYISNENGTFSKQDLTDWRVMKGDGGVNIILGDFNGDKKTDFIRQEKGAWDDDDISTANVYISNGNGTFWKQDLTDWRVMKGDFTNLIVGDFNGDGKDDFIRQEKGAWDDDDISTANVYISNGNGTFWKQDLTDWRVMKGDFTNLIVGDFNG
ncbi:MAG TPA: VCBS repeat-containing protein, partial [Leptolyngbyaceae cyanobacterium]